MIEFSCPTCSQPLSADDDKAGAEARCPGCGTVVPIPVKVAATPVSGSGEPLAGVVPTAEEKQWGMISHLSALLAIWLGGMGFLGPLVCWLAKKDSSQWIAFHAKEALNFHLNMAVWFAIGLISGCFTFGIGWVLCAIVPIYAVVLGIIAAIDANNGKLYRYPATIRVIS